MSENIYIQISVIALCYLIGSFPSAYLLVKKKHNADITREGSGNVGTFNAMVVSKSKTTGIIVLLIDLMKGFVSVYVMLFILGLSYNTVLAGSVFLILGHNYPVWLKFKGGRGLAVSAGIFLILNYYLLLVWCVLWMILKLIKTDILIANTFATFSIIIFVFLINIYNRLVVSYNIKSFSLEYFSIFSIIITIIILSRHMEVFKNLINKKSNS